MKNKTAMMKLYDMLDEGRISEIAEIKEFFLMLEEKQMKECYDIGKGGGKIRTYYEFEEYYNTFFK